MSGWWDEVVCAQTDPELFFPETGNRPREAKKVCARCPVRAECLTYALTQDRVYGVWGGTTEQERRQLTTTPKATRWPV